jgi:hypothetical protein
MQLAVTLGLVIAAAAYTAYSTLQTWLPAKFFAGKKPSNCGGGCGSCSFAKNANEKGEPVSLVPLQNFPK